MEEEKKIDNLEELAEEEQSELTEEVANYAHGMMQSKLNEVKNFSLSQKGFVRAFDYAINMNVTDKKVRLMNERERKLAFLLEEIIEYKVILLGRLYKQITNVKGEQNG